jgi:hypothetical protein
MSEQATETAAGGESLRDAAVRNATDAIYNARDEGRNMHAAGEEAADAVLALAAEGYGLPTEGARDYRGHQDFTDPMLRAAAAGLSDEIHRADTLRWMGYADQELTRLRQLLDLDGQPGYASGRPRYAKAGVS